MTSDGNARGGPPSWAPPRRAPLQTRKPRERREARRRVAAMTRVPLSAEQRRLDPQAREQLSRAGRALRAVASIMAALAVHAGILLLGIVIGGMPLGEHKPRINEEVSVQVRDRPPEPPKPEPPKPEPPAVTKPTRAAPQVAKVEPPKAPPPTAPKSPPRIVGLSLESTVEGGEGPAFGVGNTRVGQTAERAAAPSEVAPLAPAVAPGPEKPSATRANRASERIPVAGVVTTAPKPKGGKLEPKYPDMLKAQGIEGEVTVMVSVDTAGKVTSVKIIKRDPNEPFNEAALATAQVQEWEPAIRDGVAIPYTVSYTYRFRLEDE